MAERVAIVIVSHSQKVAEGAADMVREMVGQEVKVAHCGGNPDGGLGTDVARIKAAIEEVYGPAGVALLVDLGGAETNSEMAIELLPADWQERIVICNAPIVGGAGRAAAEPAGGSPLAEVRATAEELAA
jgi:PTS hybrid protein